MRVLQLLNLDSGRGGAQIMMERLHQGLRRSGVESFILCGIKTLDSPYSVQIPRFPKLENMIGRITLRMGLNDIHCLGSFRIKELELFSTSDILHIHGIHSNFFSYLALPGITRAKPTVYTLHDMWSFTGHCTYSFECERWKTGCGKCPYPHHNPRIARDNTRLEWKLKHYVFRHSNVVLITPSAWLTNLVRQSMLKHFPVYEIPNGVDTEVYQPLDKDWCRAVLGIPSNKKVLMFMAMTIDKLHSEGFRKGGDLLLRALHILPDSLKADMVLLIVGDKGGALAKASEIQTLELGYIGSDRLKAICYSASDLFVHPTRAESFGLTIIESMACGTPVVSFRVGGVPDLVRPGITGYLAKPEDARDLSDGIVQLVVDRTLRDCMSRKCREVAVQEYSLGLQVQKHIDLYNKILQGGIA